jgi:peptide/nickel transport system permease protein
MSNQPAASALVTSELGPPAVKDRRGYWRAVRRKFSHDPIAIACASILILIALAAIFAPYVAPADPYKTSVIRRLLPIGSSGYILGTDELGRDMLSRLIYGGQVSLLMGILPVMVATLAGGLLGIIAGFAGGRVNMVVMRVVEVFFAFPSVLLAVAMTGALGAGLTNCLVALSIVFTPAIARIAESTTTQIRNQGYIEAARATGASAIRIILGHVLSNVTGPILTYASAQVSVSVVIASGLSFLGLGVAPPTADWGLMLSTLRQSLFVAPVNALLPGVMILITSVSFNLLSDSLRTALDVKP